MYDEFMQSQVLLGDHKNEVFTDGGFLIWVNGGDLGIMKTDKGMIDAPALTYIIIGAISASILFVINGLWALFFGFNE